MCLLFFAYEYHQDFRLILAANRDEYFKRPTAPADFWDSHPQVLAGRDLEMMGTWMGITKSGRFAALTNYRDPSLQKADKESRGLLVSNFLCSSQSPEAYLLEVSGKLDHYNPFNLLVGNLEQLCYFNQLTAEILPLKPGIYGLSNHFLDTPWPKVQKSKQALADYLVCSSLVDPETLFDLLSDSETAPDNDLPSTGITKEWEKYLSSVFIRGNKYGTRSSTVLLIDRQNQALFWEKSFTEDQEQAMDTRKEFNLVP